MVGMDSMSGKRERRGGGREREREKKSAREKKGVECSERAGPGRETVCDPVNGNGRIAKCKGD